MRNRRDQILAAALDAFAGRGYGATSMSDLQRATGASTGSLYHHFPTKAHVAAELLCDALGRYQRGFLDALRGASGAEAGVRAAVRHHLSWVAEDPARARLLVGEPEPEVLAAAGERLRAANRVFLSAVGDWYGAAVAARELRALDPDAAVALWIGPAQELTRAHLAGRARRPPVELAEVLADGAWRALRAG
ncbi:MAG TPA: helix-turn-helix domain-containing protein [Solirubrobacteraceae bacterium]|nr:helix-turn-helix domain-containing protein [Solirubrobacteraceae bacterium]